MAEDTPPQLFVSHHSSKYDIAQQVEALLSERGIRCWIAPRDVPPGAPFDSAIGQAINECAAVLLLFCSNSDKSRHVKRELILGDSAGRPIIPLRLEAIDPGELAYHLADSQWIDWIDRREAVMDRVAAQVRLYAGAPAELADDVATLGNGLSESVAAPESTERKWLIPALIGALVLALGLAGYFALRGGTDEPSNAEILADSIAAENAASDTLEDDPASETGEEAEPRPTPSPTSRPSGPTDLVLQATPVPQPTPTVAPTRAPSQVIVAPATQQPLRRVVQACAGAATDTEYLICAHPELDARARRMGELLSQLRTEVQDNGRSLSSFNSGQREWFNSVKAECSSYSCVESRQIERIAELERLLSRFQ
ncbi:TIR domain-containing protein [uncultured Erythrobacter sp.]|uniref:TIR domain-containing protein n=1 Tax=uncultured Erythrobacter sp. TaxID=263913 RepID=UPI002608C2F6|nr:TIR domain-containing protein [uncultured Erythrobacter sp.]